MSKQPWHFGDPAERAEESARHRSEEALTTRLLVLMERRETSHSASHVLTPETRIRRMRTRTWTKRHEARAT